ncbi:MAG: SpoIIE family protein phosphatase [Saccharofermentanales bacterium]|jgi:hypothetical protein
MLHFDAHIRQVNKDGQAVCGDCVVQFTSKDSYYFGIFDGMGSGVYANLAAISLGSRWRQMIREGISISEACETIASNMARARNERIPFTAFSTAMITRNGTALLYTYEAPSPIICRGNTFHVAKPHFYTAGYEILGETQLDLDRGDALLLYSDGVSQAGLGRAYTLGWGAEGVSDLMQQQWTGDNIDATLDAVMDRCHALSGDGFEDDTTLVMIHAVPARHLSLFSGPPDHRERDPEFAEAFRNAEGIRIICGSSTSGLLARELKVPLRIISEGDGLQSPPQYAMKGADLVTEGALALNQVANLMTADREELTGDTPPEQLARHLFDADVIDIYEGTAKNEAHRMLLFRQLGIRPRRESLRMIEQSLEKMGKMVHYHSF